jgi:hypothetical protein
MQAPAGDAAQKARRAASAALPHARALVRALEQLAAISVRFDSMTAGAVEALRSARRAAAPALLDAQEAADQLIDTLSDK